MMEQSLVEITNTYDAYWFLYNHPNCVDVDPEHPLFDDANLNIDNQPEYEKALRIDSLRWFWEGQFIHNLDIHYAKVDPDTRTTDGPNPTHVEVWLETGPAYWDNYAGKYMGNSHDPSLDVGGDTFEEALIKLANRVKEKYGDYEESE